MDVIVIGGSVAGLSAALALGRGRRRVTVVDAGEPRNAPAAALHTYLSRDGAAPADLLAAGRAEVTRYGGELVPGRVAAVEGTIDGFTVQLDDGRSLGARRVLLATGVRDELPDLPGIGERWGRDVVHCPYCFGFEVADQPLGVLGAGGNPVRKALLIRNWSADVTLLAHTAVLSPQDEGLLASAGVRVLAGEVSDLVVDSDRLTGVRVASGEVCEVAALFLSPRSVACDQPVAALGVATRDLPAGVAVVTDDAGQTSVPGVWAAGSVVTPTDQLIHAAASGSRVAIALNNDLIVTDAMRAAGATSV
jgi:thioredoxin reductase